MNISFRQGLVKVPPSAFLQLSANHVSIILDTYQSIIMTFADSAANYLITQQTPVPNAWQGPFLPGIDYWLYFDINTITGALSAGSTLYNPVVGNTAPHAPVIDQHWFDTSVNQMFVWSGNSWVHKIRVFAAKLEEGVVFLSISINAPLYTGTQIGNNTPVASGAIVFDSAGLPLRKGDGTFFTTEDIALTGVSSASQVKLGSIIVNAVSTSNIAAYTIVRFTDFNKVSPVTDFMALSGSYGMVQVPASTGDTVSVTMEGIITNLSWDWTTAGINAPLYIDASGQLTATRSISGIIIATVVGIHTVLLLSALLFSSAPAPTANAATPAVLGTVKLSVPSATPSSPVVVGVNDPGFVNALNKTGGTMTGPLVLSADPTSALQPATKQYVDAISGATIAYKVAKQNTSGVVITIGTPVYSSGPGAVHRAEANNILSSAVIGLVADTTVGINGVGNIQTTDILQASPAQWDAVVPGQVGGLVEGMQYFLHPTLPGKMTTIAPANPGQYLTIIGNAISLTQMSINTQRTILL